MKTGSEYEIVGKCGSWEMWKLGNVEVGKCGSWEVWKCGNMQMSLNLTFILTWWCGSVEVWKSGNMQ